MNTKHDGASEDQQRNKFLYKRFLCGVRDSIYELCSMYPCETLLQN